MIPRNFRPTLAYKVKGFETVKYPVLASPKVDGIRCVYFDQAYSRTLKPIRNQFIQEILFRLRHELWGFDGELVVPGNFNEVSSAIMREDGQPDFKFLVFDRADMNTGYLQRYDQLRQQFRVFGPGCVELLPQEWITNEQQLAGAEIRALQDGFEGLMIRQPSAPYKHGRSTEREGFLGKIKRFMDSEAEILACEPLYRNHNPAIQNELGLTGRSSNADGLEAQALLGKIICRDLSSNRNFGVGSGFTAAQRRDYWSERHTLPGKIIKYKYLPYGALELPRHPVFLGFRDEGDF